MKRLFILTLAAIQIANYAIATDEYIINWPILKTAFFKFLESPTQEKAESITKLFPPGKSPTRTVDTYDPAIAKDIFWELGKIESMVNNGNVHAYNVAIALDEIADGENALWISEIKGAGITRFPKEYLVGVKENDMTYAWNGQSPCFDAVVVKPADAENYKLLLEARLKALESVSDTAFTKEKKCAVEILKEHMDGGPIY